MLLQGCAHSNKGWEGKTIGKQKHWAKIISGTCLCVCCERLQTVPVDVRSMANLGKPYTAAGHYKEGMSALKPALSSAGRCELSQQRRMGKKSCLISGFILMLF